MVHRIKRVRPRLVWPEVTTSFSPRSKNTYSRNVPRILLCFWADIRPNRKILVCRLYWSKLCIFPFVSPGSGRSECSGWFWWCSYTTWRSICILPSYKMKIYIWVGNKRKIHNYAVYVTWVFVLEVSLESLLTKNDVSSSFTQFITSKLTKIQQ